MIKKFLNHPFFLVPLLAGALAFMTGCAGEPFFGKVENVEHVLRDGPNDYSVLFRAGPTALEEKKLYPRDNATVKVITDVKPGEPMWVKYEGTKRRSSTYYTYVEVHVRDAASINAGGREAHRESSPNRVTQVVATKETP